MFERESGTVARVRNRNSSTSIPTPHPLGMSCKSTMGRIEAWLYGSGELDHTLAQVERRLMELGRIELWNLRVGDEVMARSSV